MGESSDQKLECPHFILHPSAFIPPKRRENGRCAGLYLLAELVVLPAEHDVRVAWSSQVTEHHRAGNGVGRGVMISPRLLPFTAELGERLDRPGDEREVERPQLRGRFRCGPLVRPARCDVL